MDAAAALGFRIDSSEVVQAANDLDRFAASATKAGAAGGKINIGGSSGSIAKLVAEVQSANSKLTAIVGTLEKIASADRATAAANDNLAKSFGAADAHVTAYRQHLEAAVSAQKNMSSATVAADAHVIAYTQHLASLSAVQGDANAHVVAYQNAMKAAPQVMGQADAHVIAYRNSLKQLGEGAETARKAITFTATDSLNATRQLADIGTTLAMGMSPFMVAIQQGPQLLDILQNKAAMTGQTLGAVFRAAGVAIWTALAPLLPILLGIGLAVGGIAAAFGLGAREINKHNKSIVDSLDLTDKQLKKVKKSGVDTAVTMGDTFKAFFEVAGERLAAMFKGPLKTANSLWDSFLNYTLKGGEIWVKAIVGGFVGAIAGIKAGWSLLPAAIGDVAIRAVNKVIDAVAFMINKGGDLINGLLDATGSLLPRVTFKATATHMANEFAGAGQDFAQAAQKGFIAGRDATNAAIDRFFTDVGKRALKNRKKLILDAAGDPEKTPKGPKSDAEKLADIYRRAEGEIAAERARGEAVGMSAVAAAQLEQKTKLLNQIEQAKIPITAAVRTEVDRLAAAYAKAKVAADTAIAIRGVTDELAKQRTTIADQAALVGLYGDALTRARIEQEALNKARAALPKGEVLSPEAEAAIKASAGKTANAQIGLDSATRGAKLRKDAEDAAYAMSLERAGLGMTGAAALSYSYVIDQLNQRKRDGQALTPAELKNIQDIGDAYGRQRYELNKLQEVSDVKWRGLDNLNTGLVDAITGVKSLGDVFKSVTEQIISDLLRIAIRRSIIEPLANTLFGGGGLQRASLQLIAGNPSIFANGGAFGTPQRFANGGAFTNQIINSPTLFKFADGGGFRNGLMGEAGPEAVMPLARDSNGKLGVRSNGGGGRPVIHINTPINITQSGSFTREDSQQLAMSAAQGAVTEIRRNIGSILSEFSLNGSIVE